MMSCKTLLRNILLICCLATLVSSCTTDVDYTMGSEFLPSNQKMELRRRVYEKGTMREGDGEAELCRLSSTRLYVTDSIASTNIGSGYFGYECSDTFGMRRSGFMTQMMFSLSLHENRGWGYRPKISFTLLGEVRPSFRVDGVFLLVRVVALILYPRDLPLVSSPGEVNVACAD